MDQHKPANMLTADELRQVFQTAVMNGGILAGLILVTSAFVLGLIVGLSGMLR